MRTFIAVFAVTKLALLGAGAIGRPGCRRRRPGSAACRAVAAVVLALFAAGGPLAAQTPTYNLVNTIGSSGSGNGQFNEIRRVAVNSAGDVWVADWYNNRIEEFGNNGQFLQAISSFGNGSFSSPQGIAVDLAGNVWVGDSANNRVVKLNGNGGYLSMFGSGGSGAGQISDAQAVAVDPSGNVWINDWWNNRIDEFTGSGAFVQMFGSNGSGAGQFAWLGGLTTDFSGNVFVADAQNNRVQQFNSSGVYLQSIGVGQLSSPNDVARDPSGNLWVASGGNNALVEFNGAGTYLGQIALSYSPASLGFGPSGTLWVADQNDNHLLEYSAVSPPSTWIIDAGGNWSAAGDWANGPPNTVNAAVLFGPTITAPRTIAVDVAVTAGTLTLNSAAKYTIAGPQTIRLQSTVGDAAINVAGGSHEISANLVLAGNTDVTVSNAADQLTLSGNISGTGLALNQYGAGTLVLAGSNTFSGAMNVNSGTLRLSNPLAVRNSTVNLAGGTLAFAAGNTSPVAGGLAGSGNLVLATAAAEPVTLSVGGDGQGTTYNGILSGAGGLVKQGTGLLALGAGQTYAGATVISGGTLRIGTGVTTGPAINVNYSPLSYTGVGPSSDSGTFWNTGTMNGTVANLKTSFQGATGASVAESGGNGQWQPGSGNPSNLLNGYLYIYLTSSPTATFTFSGLVPNTAYNVYAIACGVSGRATAFTIDGASQGLTTPSNAANCTIANPDIYAEFPAVASGAGGQIRITATALTSEGDVNGFQLVPVATSAGGLPSGTPLSIAAGATFDLSGNPQQVASLSDYVPGQGGAVTNSATSATTLTLAPAGGSTTFSGTVQNGRGGLALAVSGSGAQILSGSNTYTGPTTIAQGELVVDGWLTNSAVSVNGGTLGGRGHLGGVTVNAGGQIAPGDSLGALNVSGSLILEQGAEMDYELDTPSTSDVIHAGSLVLNGQQFTDFTFSPTANFEPGSYDLIDFASSSGSLGASASGSIAGYPATLSMQDNDLVLNVVPEPSTLALLAAGVIGLAGYGWRRRRIARVVERSISPYHAARAAELDGWAGVDRFSGRLHAHGGQGTMLGGQKE
jgi:autotransporter-associated beta strand protein